MEVLDLYDIDRCKTGRTVVRNEPFKKDEFILIVHVCILNNHGHLLIQQRHQCKKLWPNMWDIGVGGGAVSGETAQSAAERETYEELGLCINLANERPYFTINFDRGFADYFIIRQFDIQVGDIRLQSSEVQSVKWADKGEIFRMIDVNEFIPYKKSIVEMIFERQNNYSEIR